MAIDTGYTLPEDVERIDGQRELVWQAMSDGHWRTLNRLHVLTGASTPSISARLRDFRKPKYGKHTVERRNCGDGVWVYRVIANACGLLDGRKARDDDGDE